MFANTLRRQTRRALATTMRCISVPSFVPCITRPMPFSSRSVSRKRMYHWQKGKKQDVPREEEPSRNKEEGLSKIIHPPSRTLILNTIPREATESDLRAVLAPHGKVEFLCIFRRGSGKSRELGLAVFADQSAADAAIRAGLSVAGTPLRVVYGAPDPPPSREVHVASIPTSVTEADLRTALAPYGEIVTCSASVFYSLYICVVFVTDRVHPPL
ncbi:hypothetical protein C8R43DRAFT_1031404 [Mycena crocata]|nr:hypothetical protein C8R43DRAFT_1031404 [Mycena crocata]